jgi:diadenosine tetraphosphate (Ap4A) HIT family hydrolase
MSCPFCDLIETGRLLLDGGVAVAIADASPLNRGHVLVVPRRHEPNFLALRPDELEAVSRVARAMLETVIGEHHPDGFNLGVNVGRAAGQTVEHAHLHLIPRYVGDVADPRGGIRWVIPERAAYWVDAADAKVRTEP